MDWNWGRWIRTEMCQFNGDDVGSLEAVHARSLALLLWSHCLFALCFCHRQYTKLNIGLASLTHTHTEYHIDDDDVGDDDETIDQRCKSNHIDWYTILLLNFTLWMGMRSLVEWMHLSSVSHPLVDRCMYVRLHSKVKQSRLFSNFTRQSHGLSIELIWWYSLCLWCAFYIHTTAFEHLLWHIAQTHTHTHPHPHT